MRERDERQRRDRTLVLGTYGDFVAREEHEGNRNSTIGCKE